MRSTTLLIGCLLLPASAHADVIRNFVMAADQVVPATASVASGHGRATLNTAQTEIAFAVQHTVAEFASATATVYAEDWGSNGVALFALTYVTTDGFAGTWSVSPGDIAQFLAGELYVQIESPSFPAGEIRGQIDLNPDPGPGDVIVTEMMYNPASAEGDFANEVFTSNAEWIELFNDTFSDIQIGGWYFEDEDVDTNGDACTPLRSGSFPDFVLRSFELVVVIPDGEVIFGSAPSVADFKTAWGLGATESVIQLNADGTAGGAIVGNNLSNNPAADSEPLNDLPLSSPFWEPCDPFGFPRTDNEILTLSDGAQIIDLVNYGDEYDVLAGAMEWPDAGGYNSISLAPDDFPNATMFTNYTAAGNDDGAHWVAHDIGDSILGYRQAAAVGVYGGSDVGSPCRLRGATVGNLSPASLSAQVLMTPGQTKDISMQGADLTRPFFGLLLFVIKSLPAHGQLIDVASNKVITPAMVGVNGYLMPRIPFNLVRYVNDGTCGVDQFTFQTNDGLLQSPVVPVKLFVQCGEVIITEIMYNPDSLEPNPSLAEWVEIYNTTAHPIDLDGWYLADNLTRSGDLPSYILGAHSSVAVVPALTSSLKFEAAWSAPHVQATTNGLLGNGAVAGSNLNNSGETLQLVAPGGPMTRVQDVVVYRNGFDDLAWPKLSPDGPSIYMLPGGGFTAGANDSASAWAKSSNGLNGAYQAVLAAPIYESANAPGFPPNDQGSPGILPNILQGACSAAGPAHDGNGDGAVDISDLEHFVLCQRGPQQATPLNCACFDEDVDLDVDLHDFELLQRGLTEIPPVQVLLISEVVDGTLPNGEPKFIELTNCGDAPVNLALYRLAIYSNGNLTPSFSTNYGAMSGLLPSGGSYVISNIEDGPGDSFLAVFGEEADFYHAVANGNGNDAYRLMRTNGVGGDIVADVYGVVGVDGTGQPWEYLDSFARSNVGRAPNGGSFNAANWTFGGPNAMDGFTPAQIAGATSAGTHTCD